MVRLLSWLVIFGALACTPATDPDVRWRSLSGVFDDIYSRRERCQCKRADALESGRTDWQLWCEDGATEALYLLWSDEFPGPNRRLAGSIGAVYLNNDSSKLLKATTTGSALLEYSTRVPAKDYPNFLPERRLFLDTLVLTVDPRCQDQGGASCERESRLDGFEIWCDDTSSLTVEP